MPTYRVTGPDGRTLRLTGDSPPTERDLEDIWSALEKQAPPPADTEPRPETIAEQPAPATGSQWTEPFRGAQRGLLAAGSAMLTTKAAPSGH